MKKPLPPRRGFSVITPICSMIYEKAGKYEDAKRHCGFYLIGLTDPAQMTDVKRRIAGLEFGIEKANSPQAQVERGRDEFADFLRRNEGAIFKSSPRLGRKGNALDYKEAKIEKGVVVIGLRVVSEERLRYNPHLRGVLSSAMSYPVTKFTSAVPSRNSSGSAYLETLTFSRDGKTLTTNCSANGKPCTEDSVAGDLFRRVN